MLNVDNGTHTDNVAVLEDTNVNVHRNLDANVFSILEIRKAILDVKNSRAVGFDELPPKVFKNENMVFYLHKFFNFCFQTGTIPKIWGKSIINPIPKSSTVNTRDPLSYRGIAVTPVVYKIYCSLLNSKLTEVIESGNVLFEGQNGFRKGRSTIDHLSSLTNIIDTRRRKKLSTFCAFIDLKKAYDSVNRDILWGKLNNVIDNKLFNAIRSLYSNVMCTVKVNNFFTDWFNVKTGLKQGCALSPMLFNLYINDLAIRIDSLGKGIDIDGVNCSILLFADDIVLISDNAVNLQCILDELNIWCTANCMNINANKSNVVHFRNKSVDRCQFLFKWGNAQIDYVSQYKYLGLVLSEHLDYSVTAKFVAQAASRALGLLMAKSKSIGGFPYEAFTKLFESTIIPIITYGASVWSNEEFSCINAVQHRAARYLLNVGKYTPNAAVNGDIGWMPMICKTKKAVINQWSRLVNMSDDRINRKVFVWADRAKSRNCKNWNFVVEDFLKKYDLADHCDITQFSNKVFICQTLLPKLHEQYVEKWRSDINRVNANRGNGRNKLRFYRCFKHSFETEPYCKSVLNRAHRGAIAKFRSGTAPINVEIGRYNNVPYDQRSCAYCKNIGILNVVEDEKHVLLECPLYIEKRSELLSKAESLFSGFENLSCVDKLNILLHEETIVNCTAKTCYNILDKRRLFVSHTIN